MVNKLFDSEEDLRVFSEAQTSTIINLNKKINELNEENKHLKNLLEKSTPIISAGIMQESDDEETISRTQLRILRNVSMERELTLEECRKVDTYAKLLIALLGKTKTIQSKTKDISTEELLKLVESE